MATGSVEVGETLTSNEIYKGRKITVVVEDVRLPNGRRRKLEKLQHPGAAAVVPVDRNGNVHLVRQYRHATGKRLLEVPAGTLEAKEPPEQCALRETEEEVGLRPRSLLPLGPIWTTPGFTNEVIHLFLAVDLVQTQQALEPDEIIDVEVVPFARAVEMAYRGEIEDAKSICALLRAASRPEVGRFMKSAGT